MINYTPYMITIVCQQKKAYVSQDDIEEVLDWLAVDADCLHVDGAYELDPKYKQLHYHGIVKAPRQFRWAPWTQYGCVSVMEKTFRIWWKPISGGASMVQAYIHKANPMRNHIRQQQILIENAGQHEYLFVN